MVAAGRLYAVHCLWWVRRRGRERCTGEREGGRIIRASISINTAVGERSDAGSSGTAQEEGGEEEEEEEEEEEAGLPSLCMQISRIPEHRCHVTAPEGRLRPAQRRCSRVRGAVSAQRWCHDLFWGCDVRPLQWGWWRLQRWIHTCCAHQPHNKCWSESTRSP